MTKQNAENVYDSAFFNYTSAISDMSSGAMVPIVKSLLPNIQSVVDFGCAQGVWLSKWQKSGVSDFVGLDGAYVDTSKLRIPLDCFIETNLNESIKLGRKFDLAYSLEVAEHLLPSRSKQFVASLTRHADIVLFSAAPPGQGGESHINEQNYEYWQSIFAEFDYIAYDCLRPEIGKNTSISYWYRYNSILYVKKGCEMELSEEIRLTRVVDGQKISDISPLWFKIRKTVVMTLPDPVQNVLARIKAMISD